jgi:hypothetical protein
MAETLTHDELQTLHKGVTGAGLLVSLSDRSFFDTFKEAGALARHVSGARSSSSSPVVREVAALGGGTGFGVTSHPEKIEQETIAALQTAVSLLEAKAPEELDAYRSFVLEVAQSVADAAAGGEAAETEAVGKVRSALGSA